MGLVAVRKPRLYTPNPPIPIIFKIFLLFYVYATCLRCVTCVQHVWSRGFRGTTRPIPLALRALSSFSGTLEQFGKILDGQTDGALIEAAWLWLKNDSFHNQTRR